MLVLGMKNSGKYPQRLCIFFIVAILMFLPCHREMKAAYGQMKGAFELKSTIDYHLLAPAGWNTMALGVNSGFFIRSHFSLQLLLQMDVLVFSEVEGDHSVFGRRAFEVAPGIRWWMMPEWRLSPYGELYFSLPMLFRTKNGVQDDLFLNQGLRYGGGVIFDYSDGYGVSMGVSLMHYFKEEFLTFMEWSLSGIVVF